MRKKTVTVRKSSRDHMSSERGEVNDLADFQALGIAERYKRQPGAVHADDRNIGPGIVADQHRRQASPV